MHKNIFGTKQALQFRFHLMNDCDRFQQFCNSDFLFYFVDYPHTCGSNSYKVNDPAFAYVYFGNIYLTCTSTQQSLLRTSGWQFRPAAGKQLLQS